MLFQAKTALATPLFCFNQLILKGTQRRKEKPDTERQLGNKMLSRCAQMVPNFANCKGKRRKRLRKDEFIAEKFKLMQRSTFYLPRRLVRSRRAIDLLRSSYRICAKKLKKICSSIIAGHIQEIGHKLLLFVKCCYL